MESGIVNVLTIDLEDYYMVSAFEPVVKREDWHKYESRIERNTHRLLDILNGSLRNPQSAIRNPVRATFFCLGWIAEHYPHLIKEIHQQGHEIACHSYDHQLIYNMNPEQFREDVRVSKRILEDITGKQVVGYRAPSYSITRNTLWALRILAEEGYRYDSSIFPIHHDRYGIPDAPRFPFIISLNGNSNFESKITLNFDPRTPKLGMLDSAAAPKCSNPQSEIRNPKSILEIPLSTVKLFGINVPISGGGYMRLLPYGLIRRGLAKINQVEKHPFVFYLHPWELDPEQPRVDSVSAMSRLRHYTNLEGTAEKLKKLLSDFSFSYLGHVIGMKGVRV
jgi:polysaccharide deacetylase family protein (PEP-CTERM system associated)